jgi:hypothetical protein
MVIVAAFWPDFVRAQNKAKMPGFGRGPGLSGCWEANFTQASQLAVK